MDKITIDKKICEQKFRGRAYALILAKSQGKLFAGGGSDIIILNISQNDKTLNIVKTMGIETPIKGSASNAFAGVFYTAGKHAYLVNLETTLISKITFKENIMGCIAAFNGFIFLFYTKDNEGNVVNLVFYSNSGRSLARVSHSGSVIRMFMKTPRELVLAAPKLSNPNEICYDVYNIVRREDDLGVEFLGPYAITKAISNVVAIDQKAQHTANMLSQNANGFFGYFSISNNLFTRLAEEKVTFSVVNTESDEIKTPVESPETISLHGFKTDRTQRATIANYPLGEPITIIAGNHLPAVVSSGYGIFVCDSAQNVKAGPNVSIIRCGERTMEITAFNLMISLRDMGITFKLLGGTKRLIQISETLNTMCSSVQMHNLAAAMITRWSEGHCDQITIDTGDTKRSPELFFLGEIKPITGKRTVSQRDAHSVTVANEMKTWKEEDFIPIPPNGDDNDD